MRPHVIVIGRHNSLKRWSKLGWREVSNMHLGGGVFVFNIEKVSYKKESKEPHGKHEQPRNH